jgi:hypothetical protein
MEMLIPLTAVAIFYLSQAYNTWYGKKLWKNFNIVMYRGVNLSRERRKACFRNFFILLSISTILIAVGSFL